MLIVQVKSLAQHYSSPKILFSVYRGNGAHYEKRTEQKMLGYQCIGLILAITYEKFRRHPRKRSGGSI